MRTMPRSFQSSPGLPIGLNPLFTSGCTLPSNQGARSVKHSPPERTRGLIGGTPEATADMGSLIVFLDSS